MSIHKFIFVTWALMLGFYSCNQPDSNDQSEKIDISSLIVWEDGDDLVIQYLKALEAADISLKTNEEYDDNNAMTKNEIVLIIQGSKKAQNKSYNEQLLIARKLKKIIYQELGYPDSYTAIEIFMYDEYNELILKDSHILTRW